MLIAAYIGAVLVEQEAAKRDLLPPRYLWLRWGFTLVAVAMMITVLTLRLLGADDQFFKICLDFGLDSCFINFCHDGVQTMSEQTSVTAEIIPFPSRRPAPHGG